MTISLLISILTVASPTAGVSTTAQKVISSIDTQRIYTDKAGEAETNLSQINSFDVASRIERIFIFDEGAKEETAASSNPLRAVIEFQDGSRLELEFRNFSKSKLRLLQEVGRYSRATLSDLDHAKAKVFTLPDLNALLWHVGAAPLKFANGDLGDEGYSRVKFVAENSEERSITLEEYSRLKAEGTLRQTSATRAPVVASDNSTDFFSKK